MTREPGADRWRTTGRERRGPFGLAAAAAVVRVMALVTVMTPVALRLVTLVRLVALASAAASPSAPAATTTTGDCRRGIDRVCAELAEDVGFHCGFYWFYSFMLHRPL